MFNKKWFFAAWSNKKFDWKLKSCWSILGNNPGDFEHWWNVNTDIRSTGDGECWMSISLGLGSPATHYWCPVSCQPQCNFGMVSCPPWCPLMPSTLNSYQGLPRNDLVGGLEHVFFLYGECHHPNWRTTIIFQSGRSTTNQWLPGFPMEPQMSRLGERRKGPKVTINGLQKPSQMVSLWHWIAKVYHIGRWSFPFTLPIEPPTCVCVWWSRWSRDTTHEWPRETARALENGSPHGSLGSLGWSGKYLIYPLVI